MLSDGTIRKLMAEGRLKVGPIHDHQIQPASIDLRLLGEFGVFDGHHDVEVDPAEGIFPDIRYVGCSSSFARQPGAYSTFVLHPGEFVLAGTFETIELPRDIVARVEGKSSLGRLGLLIHATAGFIDPGFRGQITLELSNVSRVPIRLTPGMQICQVSFLYLDRPSERPYGHPALRSKYQDQIGVTASEYATTETAS